MALWQTPELDADKKQTIQEHNFSPKHFPIGKTIQTEMANLQQAEETRHAPLKGKIKPHARLTVYEYRKQIDEWYARLDESLETNTMKPGAISATVDKTTGDILNITSQGQSATAGLRIGWHLRKVDGQNYSEQQLAMCTMKKQNYSITVEKQVPTVEQRVVLEKSTNTRTD